MKHISTLCVDPGRDLWSKLFTLICNPISLCSKLSSLNLQPCLIQQKIVLPVSETHVDDLSTIKRIKLVMLVKEGLRIPLMTSRTHRAVVAYEELSLTEGVERSESIYLSTWCRIDSQTLIPVKQQQGSLPPQKLISSEWIQNLDSSGV